MGHRGSTSLCLGPNSINLFLAERDLACLQRRHVDLLVLNFQIARLEVENFDVFALLQIGALLGILQLVTVLRRIVLSTGRVGSHEPSTAL